MADWYRWDGAELILAVRTQPRASKDEFAGPQGDALKVRITAPPVEGRANAHLCRFLADAFGVAKSQVELISGDTARAKRFRIRAPRVLPLGIGRAD